MNRILAMACVAALLPASSPGGVAPDGQEIDPVMEARIRTAWSEVRRLLQASDPESASLREQLQREYGGEFFTYYRKHPATSTGEKAARDAFSLWANVGATEEVEAALPHIGADSRLWSEILRDVARIHYAAGRRTELLTLLRDLEGRLTHPASRAEVLLHLAADEERSGRLPAAAGHYELVLTLEASPTQTQRARAAIREINTLSVGMPAPDFEAATLAGERFWLSAQRGKVVLIEFWATSCVPCIWEIPRLKRLSADLPATEFRLVGVARNDEPEALTRFLREKEMSWAQIRQTSTFEDGVWVMDPVLSLYNVSGVPRSFLIGRDGTILAKDLRGEVLECATRQAVRASSSTGASSPASPRPAPAGHSGTGPLH